VLKRPGSIAPNLAEALIIWARESPDDTAFVFLDTELREVGRHSFASLLMRARALANELGRRRFRGERVLLLARNPAELVPAFFGCLLAGAVAVPTIAPTRREGLNRLSALFNDCAPRGAIIEQDLAASPAAGHVAALFGDDPLAVLTASDTWTSGGDQGPGAAVEIRPETLALLQYTSGSTGDPKGVMLTHANLMANVEMMAEAFDIPSRTTVVSWLPLFHDMGLIGNVVASLVLGNRCVLMPPAAFTRRPLAWLDTIARYRASVSGGPNFAYDLCARSAKDAALDGLDLSCWQVAYTGAEPVRADTARRFAARFAPCGYRAEATVPTYGLAEATLFVTASRPGAGVVELPDRAALVSCGSPCSGTDILIVDPTSCTTLPLGQVGEVWVRGPSVSAGYWKRPEATRQVFQATVRDDPDQHHRLRTGDLGLLHQGELYLTGRLKDVIIIAGRNYHPPDIEQIVDSAHPILAGNLCAALGISTDGVETVVVVAEVGRESWHRLQREPRNGPLYREVLAKLQDALMDALDLSLAEMVLVPLGRLPRTTSGKIRRSHTKVLLEAGEIRAPGRPLDAPPRGPRFRGMHPGRAGQRARAPPRPTPRRALLPRSWPGIAACDAYGSTSHAGYGAPGVTHGPL
jgi:acyl-CoA synthetase (AMP-forming)/AMP-acid ligase II